MILLIDNYDSFVYNLARYFERLGHATQVIRNTDIDSQGVRDLHPAAMVLSPGPCTPDEAGCSLELVRQLHTELPILGICLGHQTIVQALGGRILRAREPMHGRTSSIHHNQLGIFAGLPSPFLACRYHSLVVDETSLPSCLEVTAHTGRLGRQPIRATARLVSTRSRWSLNIVKDFPIFRVSNTEDGEVMAIQHRTLPIIGLQFHPESILTEHGYAILAAFLQQAKLSTPTPLPTLESEWNPKHHTTTFTKESR